MTDSRYPGVTSFEDSLLSSRLFFGRGEETNDLLHAILAEDLTILYARSGHGKTSLLQAGVFPLLRDRLFYPITIRLNKKGISPEDIIRNELIELRQENRRTIMGFDSQDFLLKILKDIEIWSIYNKLFTPVLVFDQFEEIFTLNHNRVFQKPFFDFIRELLSEINEHRLPLKIVISIREDFLGSMESLARQIPSIFSNRFRLNGLTREGAEDALLMPAKIKMRGIGFVPPFSFSPKAKNDLLSYFSLKRIGDIWIPGEDVDPIQLQIICSDIEQRIKDGKINPDANGKLEITEDILGGYEGMKKMLGNFYQHLLQNTKTKFLLNDEQLNKLEDIIEKELIADKRRVPLDYNSIILSKKIDKEAIDFIIDRKLLHKESRGENQLVEISHDVLVAPILETLEKRESARIENEKREMLLAEREKLEQEKVLIKKRRRALFVRSITASTLSIIIITICAYFVKQAWQARKQATDAIKQAAEAKQQIIFSRDSINSLKNAYKKDIDSQRLNDSIKLLNTRNSLTGIEVEIFNNNKELNSVRIAIRAKIDSLIVLGKKDSALSKTNIVLVRKNDSTTALIYANYLATASIIEGKSHDDKAELISKALAYGSLYYSKKYLPDDKGYFGDNVQYTAIYDVLIKEGLKFDTAFPSVQPYSVKGIFMAPENKGKKTIHGFSIYGGNILKSDTSGASDTIYKHKGICESLYETAGQNDGQYFIYAGYQNGKTYRLEYSRKDISVKELIIADRKTGIDFIQADEKRHLLVVATQTHIYIMHSPGSKVEQTVDFEINNPSENTITEMTLRNGIVYAKLSNGETKWYATNPLMFYLDFKNQLKKYETDYLSLKDSRARDIELKKLMDQHFFDKDAVSEIYNNIMDVKNE
jgi:hypothetical protein